MFLGLNQKSITKGHLENPLVFRSQSKYFLFNHRSKTKLRENGVTKRLLDWEAGKEMFLLRNTEK